jgi:hypothetical protein
MGSSRLLDEGWNFHHQFNFEMLEEQELDHITFFEQILD